MASWTQLFSANNKYSITLEATESSYNIQNNTSVISYKLTMATANQSYVGYSNLRTTISIQMTDPSGTTTTLYTYNASRDFNPTATAQHSETLKSGTVTVTHKTDGTGSAVFSASVSVASSEYSPGSASLSGKTLTLYNIPRASTASWSGDFTIGTGTAITIARASSSYTHILKFTVGSTSSQTGSVGTSYTWTPSAATWASAFPTQTSRTGTMTVETYSGSTLIGTNAYTFTLKIPDSWKPSIQNLTLSPESDDAFITGTGKYVAGYSAIRVQIRGTAAQGAAIASYTISGAFSRTVTTSSTSPADQTSQVFTSSGSKSVTVTVTDARGRTGSATASCSFDAYAAPSVSSLTYARGTYSGGSWTDSDTGTDLKITFKGKCSLSSDGNNLASWNVGSPVNANGTNLASDTLHTVYKTGIGTTTAYSVQVTVTDQVGNTASRYITVPTIEMPFVLDVAKPAVGVGAVPQTVRMLQLANDWVLGAGGGIALPQTTNIFTSALAQAAGYIKAWRGSGNSYTGTVPDDSYKTGVFLVSAAYTNSVYVLALPSDAKQGLAFNVYTGTWSGWMHIGNDRYVDKTQAVTFSAGTIGSRAQSYSWTQSDIGGAPKYMQIINSTGLASFMPICTIASTNAYLNIYRSVSTAYSSGSITVRIWY